MTIVKRFETTKRVRHPADAMYDLVMDVERYPEFVPLCQRLRVRSREEREDGTVVIIADMTVAYKFIRETFTSKVVGNKHNRTITVNYLEGPFQELENVWIFKEVDDLRSDVTFKLQYEFRSRTLSALMGAMFDKAFRKFSTAFEERANAVYGHRRLA